MCFFNNKKVISYLICPKSTNCQTQNFPLKKYQSYPKERKIYYFCNLKKQLCIFNYTKFGYLFKVERKIGHNSKDNEIFQSFNYLNLTVILPPEFYCLSKTLTNENSHFFLFTFFIYVILIILCIFVCFLISFSLKWKIINF